MRDDAVNFFLSTTRGFLSDFVLLRRTLARLVTTILLRPLRYHLVSRLHFSIDDEVVDDAVVLRSAPGAALPQNGLVRLFISGKCKSVVNRGHRLQRLLRPFTYQRLTALFYASHPKRLSQFRTDLFPSAKER